MKANIVNLRLNILNITYIKSSSMKVKYLISKEANNIPTYRMIFKAVLAQLSIAFYVSECFKFQKTMISITKGFTDCL